MKSKEWNNVLPLDRQGDTEVSNCDPSPRSRLYRLYKQQQFFFKRTIVGRHLLRAAVAAVLLLAFIYFFSDEDERLRVTSKVTSKLSSINWPIGGDSGNLLLSPGKLSDAYKVTPILSSIDYDYQRAFRVVLDNRKNREEPFNWSDWLDMDTAESFVGIQPDDSNWPFSKYCNINKLNPFQAPINNCTQMEIALNGRLYLANHSLPAVNVVVLGRNGQVVTVGRQAASTSDNSDNLNKKHLEPFSTLLESTRIEHKLQVPIDKDLFEFDVKKLTQITDDMPQESKIYAQKVKEWLAQASESTKYFDECYFDEDRYEVGSHYDWRFFDGIRQGEEHEAILYRMIRAWAQFAEQEGILSWISHGSLLGWYWNGLPMPYDSDNDIQMPVMELVRFSRLYNQTIVLEDQTEGTGRYFIDVSPWHVERVRGNGMNVIDARFIDMRSGIYLDITGLTNTAKTNRKRTEDNDKKDNQHYNDTDLVEASEEEQEEEEYGEEYEGDQEQEQGHRGYRVNCKNHHFYPLEDLSPIRRTLYQGLQVYIPNNFEDVLESEYPEYKEFEFRGWVFDGSLNMWVPEEKCKDHTDMVLKFDKSRKLTLYGACDDEHLYQEYQRTHDLVSSHFEEMNVYYGSNNWHPPTSVQGPSYGQLNLGLLSKSEKQRLAQILAKKFPILRPDPI